MKKHKSIITISAVLAAVMFIFSHPSFAERGAGVSKEMLPRELRGITINNAFIPSSGKEAGVIQEVSGAVIVARENLQQAYFAAPGDKIYEKDTFFTLKNSRCRFRLLFEDVISVGDNAKISVTKFIDDRKSQEKHASFNMVKGKVMFYTMRLFRYKNASMTVDTPTSIAGVRGTKFGVEVALLKEDTDTAGKPIYVADASDKAFIHLAQANSQGSVTNVHAFDGNLYVTSTSTNQTQSISSGQSTSSSPTGLGAVVSTPPGVTQKFQQNTGGSGSGGADAGTGTGDSAGGGTSGTTTDTGGTSTVVDTTNITQTQNPPPPPPPPPPAQAWQGTGYFTGLLSVQNSGRQFEGAYISTTPQNFAASIQADNITGVYTITGNGSSQSVTGIATSLYGTFSGSKPVTVVDLGFTEYMSWGSWTQPLAMTTNSVYDLFFDNPNYTVNGAVTATLPLTGTYDYAGPAYGTLFSTSGGLTMTGGFTANVNFNTAQITNYNMAVAGGTGPTTSSASIIGAVINLVPGSPNFSAIQTNGTWTLVANTVGAAGNVTTGKLYGSFFGPTANNMGSAWGMTTGANNAAGIAIGNSKAAPF